MIFKTIFKNFKFELYVYDHDRGTCRGQKRSSDPLERELEKVLCELPALGTEHYMNTARALYAFNHWSISLAPLPLPLVGN